MKNIKNIVLDYDGTLYNSLKTYAPAFRKAYEYLVANSYAEDRVWSDEEISKWLGISSKDMWQDFMPDLPENEKIRGSSTIESYMVKYIKEGRGELYEGVIDTLNYLKNKEYNLIFLSNCKIAYMNEHRRIFQLDKYFSDYYCTENFGNIPKHEIFPKIKNKYNGEFVVIGDRYLDLEIATINNEKFIGCSYGYGSKDELNGSDIIINNIKELKLIL